MNAKAAALAVIVSMLAVSPAPGEEARRIYREGEVPAVSDLVSVFGEKGGASAGKSKLGRRKSFSDSAVDDTEELSAKMAGPDPKLVQHASSAAAAASAPANPQSVAIPIRFKRNSDAVASSEVKTLENIAQAMRQVGGSARFMVEGHTDATGSSSYNVKLSMLRALSVKEQLVKYGVPAQALVVAGAGSAKLLDPRNPSAGVNRRVEFKRITAE